MNTPKKIVITGATGFLGKRLVAALSTKGYALVIFSRSPDSARKTLGAQHEYRAWQGGESPELHAAVNGAHAVIHLAGASVAGGRWTEKYKALILNSRTRGTQAVSTAIVQAEHPPEVFFCASAVGYYGNSGDEYCRETTPPAKDFLAMVCTEWEAATKPAETKTRVVRGRIGVVLDKHEGALAKMLLPFKLFFGGHLGSGRQWFSWVHPDDVVGMILWSLEQPNIRGAMNIVAPEAVRMADFAKALGKILRRPSMFPVPAFVLKLILGEQAWIAISGQHVLPEVAEKQGYTFHFPKLEGALGDLVGKS